MGESGGVPGDSFLLSELSLLDTPRRACRDPAGKGARRGGHGVLAPMWGRTGWVRLAWEVGGPVHLSAPQAGRGTRLGS